MTEKPRVLFLCTHNAARSQLAEALLRRHAGHRFEVSSAGLDPTAVHSLTVQVLQEVGIETDDLRAKSLKEFLGKVTVKYAVVVCEDGEAVCPRLYPFATQVLYWPYADPSAGDEEPAARLARFRRLRDDMEVQIRRWLRGA